MIWRNNSFSCWMSDHRSFRSVHYKAAYPLMLFFLMLLLFGGSGCESGENGLQNELEFINEGAMETVESDPLDRRQLTPAIDQNVPARLETATLALG